ncbi:hypothetical protein V1280_000644 [Bradyrhizobium sp. AZCC 2230]
MKETTMKKEPNYLLRKLICNVVIEIIRWLLAPD